MNNSSGIKTMYLTLFILMIIELVFFITFIGYLLGIAVFIISLILQSKLKVAENFSSKALKLNITGSILYIGNIIFVILHSTTNIFFPSSAASIIFWILIPVTFLTSFITLIIGCIFTYKEYKPIV